MFLGFSTNCLMWEKAVLRWKMTTDHPVQKFGTKVINSLDWTVQAFVDAKISTDPATTRRRGVNFEGFGRQGLLDPGRRVQILLRKSTVQRGKRQGRVSATIHDKKVGADRGGFSSFLVTMPTTTWGAMLKEGARLLSSQNRISTEFDDVARALNMLDVESQEGIIKPVVKNCGALLHRSRKIQRKFAVRRRDRRTGRPIGRRRRRTLSSSGRGDGRQLDRTSLP